MVGETVGGKYQVLRLLGEGGMGAVYEALHTHTQRRVALKVLRGAGPLGDSSREERFAREARVSARIETPHIAEVLDAGTDPVSGARFLVFELLAGEDLEAMLERVHVLPADVALRIAAQTCRGLARAHDAHVIHRDIKPANLFLAKRPEGGRIVKILDFGIAKIRADANAGNEAMTRTGWMLGSPLYMSPEQARGIKDVDHRTDVWSVGVVMYRMLCGRTPHSGIEAMGDLIMAICHLAPTNVRSISPWVPPPVADVVHRALRTDPKERFQSALEMLDAIVALLPNGEALDDAMLVSQPNAPRPASPAHQGGTTIHESDASVKARFSEPPARNSHAPESHADTVAQSASAMESPSKETPTDAAAARAGGRLPRSRTPLVVAGVLACALGGGIIATTRGHAADGAHPETGASGATAQLSATAATTPADVTPTVAATATGTMESPTGTLQSPTGTLQSPTGTLQSPTGTLQSPTGMLQSPTGMLQSPTAPHASGKASATAAVTASASAKASAAATASARATSQPTVKPTADPLLPDRLE
ncbi:MAG: protein kinase [Polyangiaceae bacterium]